VNLDSSYKIGSLQVEVHPGGVVTPRKESAEQNTKMRELSPRTVLRELSPVSVRMVGGGGGQQTRSRDTSPRQTFYIQWEPYNCAIETRSLRMCIWCCLIANILPAAKKNNIFHIRLERFFIFLKKRTDRFLNVDKNKKRNDRLLR